MKFLYKAFRINEWFNSKLTMQIGIFLMLAFCCGLDSVSLLKPFIIFVLYAITYFALGYIANDLSDIESDKKRVYPPYKFEIEMIKNKTNNPKLLENIREYYKKI